MYTHAHTHHTLVHTHKHTHTHSHTDIHVLAHTYIPEGNPSVTARVTIVPGRCAISASLFDDSNLPRARPENWEYPKSMILGYAPEPVNLNQHDTLTPAVREARSNDVVVLR